MDFLRYAEDLFFWYADNSDDSKMDFDVDIITLNRRFRKTSYTFKTVYSRLNTACSKIVDIDYCRVYYCNILTKINK